MTGLPSVSHDRLTLGKPVMMFTSTCRIAATFPIALFIDLYGLAHELYLACLVGKHGLARLYKISPIYCAYGPIKDNLSRTRDQAIL